MPKALPTTVVSIPLVSHLRREGDLNAAKALTEMAEQAQRMVDHLRWSLLALAGRWPRAVHPETPDWGDRLEAVRTAVGMPNTGPCEAHWLWLYQADQLRARVSMVPLEVLEAEIRRMGHEVVVATRRLSFTIEGKERAFNGQVGGGRVLVARDSRDRVKGSIWDAAAASGASVTHETELTLGDSVPYYLAGWILRAAEPPASLVSAAPEYATELMATVGRAFRHASEEAAGWRLQVAEALGRPPVDAKVTTCVRTALSACCYETLKGVRSWVALDTMAEADRTAREERFRSALTISGVDSSRSGITHLLAAIDARAEGTVSETPVMHSGSLDWRACAALRSALSGGPWEYEREGTRVPWTHPDLDGFWSAFTTPEHRPALVALVSLEVDAESTSLGEIHRSWTRAQGYARLSVSGRARIHVDASNAGVTGRLASATDTADPTRLRGGRGQEPTRVVLASVDWLGQTHQLRFHQGRNRTLDLVTASNGWSATLARNARTGATQTGIVKAFDLSLRENRVRLDLPIQVDLTSYADTGPTKRLAIGGWYYARPGGDLMAGSAKLTPPESAIVLGLDVGMSPIGGFSVIAKSGDRYQEIEGGLIGDLEGIVDTTIYVPGLTLRALGQDLRLAHQVRRHLHHRLRSGSDGMVGPKPRRARDLDAGHVALIEEAAAVPDAKRRIAAAISGATLTLLPLLADAAAASVTTGTTVLIGSERIAGRGLLAEAHDRLVERLIAGGMAGTPHVNDPTIRSVVQLLLRPLASLLLGYQRQRTCRSDLGTVSRKHGLDEAMVCQRRDHIANRHGYQTEAAYWSIAHLGATSATTLTRGSDADHDRALSIRLMLADVVEGASDLGRSMAGWGSAPLAFGTQPKPEDPRAVWDQHYGFLRTHAASIRSTAHEGLCQRAIQIAKLHMAKALVIENLDLATTTRVDPESNNLTRRLAAADWMQMMRRASELAGIPLVLGDAWWSTREVAPLTSDGRLAPREMAFRRGQTLVRGDGQIVGVHPRHNAARNLAIRSLSGYPQRVQIPVTLVHQEALLFARLRAATLPGRQRWAAWQHRLAADLGVSEPENLGWAVSPTGVATLTPLPAALPSDGQATRIVASGGHWLTMEAFAAQEKSLT